MPSPPHRGGALYPTPLRHEPRSWCHEVGQAHCREGGRTSLAVGGVGLRGGEQARRNADTRGGRMVCGCSRMSGGGGGGGGGVSPMPSPPHRVGALYPILQQHESRSWCHEVEQAHCRVTRRGGGGEESPAICVGAIHTVCRRRSASSQCINHQSCDSVWVREGHT